MTTERRTVLAAVAGVLTAGCAGTDGGTPTGGESPTRTDSSTPVGTPERCDPDDVTRSPVATGGNIEGRQYPGKPATLTEQSILEYLDDFETAFAWNRVLQTAGVTSLNVENLDGFAADETGDGYLASSGMRVTYSTEDGTESDREYVANYFVSPGPVYRVESEREPAAPREQQETQLVQCGPDEATAR